MTLQRSSGPFFGVIAVIAIVGLSVLGINYLMSSVDYESDSSVLDFSFNPEEDTPITLREETVVFEDGSEATFSIASDFDIEIAAEEVGKARFLTMSPDGRLFVPDMVNFEDNTSGSIYILDDWNSETFEFESRNTYLTDLRNPHSIAFYTDEGGEEWIYIALTHQLIRYPYESGDNAPDTEPEVIMTFPDYRTVDGDVWHITRTVVFHEGEMYISVGSSCNICEEPEDEYRAEILVMTPEGENIRTYASGIKNAVGLAWAGDAFFATENGVDHLGTDAPDDVMYRVEEGENYGWPYCYELDGEVLEETEWTWYRDPIACEDIPLSFVSFGPHTAPLGVTYFEDAHPVLDDSFLVALHGSYQVEIGNGYELVRVDQEGNQEVFMEGFLLEDNERVGRPVHVLQNDENSFFMSDDHNGRIYYVYARS